MHINILFFLPLLCFCKFVNFSIKHFNTIKQIVAGQIRSNIKIYIYSLYSRYTNMFIYLWHRISHMWSDWKDEIRLYLIIQYLYCVFRKNHLKSISVASTRGGWALLSPLELPPAVNPLCHHGQSQSGLHEHGTVQLLLVKKKTNV